MVYLAVQISPTDDTTCRKESECRAVSAAVKNGKAPETDKLKKFYGLKKLDTHSRLWYLSHVLQPGWPRSTRFLYAVYSFCIQNYLF